MKNTVFCLLLLVFPLFQSCTEDNEVTFTEPSVSAAQLMGKWSYDKQIFAINNVTQPTTAYAGNEPGCAADFLRFEGQQLISGDYTTGCSLSETTGSWSVSHRTINMALNGQVRNFAVEEITNTTMQLKQLDTGDDVYRYTFIKGTIISN